MKWKFDAKSFIVGEILGVSAMCLAVAYHVL